jgi:hypothetical protein
MVNIEGQDLNIVKPLKYKFTDPVRGELYEPLVVLPPVLISPDEKIKISKAIIHFPVFYYMTGKKKGFQTFLKDVGKDSVDNIKVQYIPDHLVFEDKNKMIRLVILSRPIKDNDYYFATDANNGRKDVYHLGMKEVKYDHIPYINYFT